MQEEKSEDELRTPVSYSVQGFWKVMREFTFHPSNVNRRIAFAFLVEIDSNQEDIEKIEFNQVKEENISFFQSETDKSWDNAIHHPIDSTDKVRYWRKIHSKMPNTDSDVVDVVVFDYNHRVVTYTPFIPRSVERQDKYLPFCYPNLRKLSYSYENSEFIVRSKHFDTDWYRPIWERILASQIKLFNKWGKREDEGGYQKRVHHDLVIPQPELYKTYHELKAKYKFFVDIWTEVTDPAKYVFEELGIASFLICLFTAERKLLHQEEKQSFVDMGCGNGFLTFILSNEGYKGKGIDIAARQIWEEYSKYGKKPELVTEVLYPDKLFFSDVDWIIGNHSDELTPWIPLIASKSSSRYFILPCCPFDFGGKFQGKVDQKLGRYRSYLSYLEQIGRQCGYQVEQEVLRIPSTKNVAHIGRRRTFDVLDSTVEAQLDQQRNNLLLNYSGTFTPRRTDRELHRERQDKQNRKSRIKHKKNNEQQEINSSII